MKEVKILVCGGRNFADQHVFDTTMSQFLTDDFDIRVIIEGGALGADSMARVWAMKRGIPTATFLANWDKFHKAAGPIRNMSMLDIMKPDLVVAFPGGRGTADMVMRAKSRGIEVMEIFGRKGE